MICGNCRKAGKLNKLNNLIKGALGQEIIQQIEDLYGKCRGGTHCFCQHVIGDVIRKGG